MESGVLIERLQGGELREKLSAVYAQDQIEHHEKRYINLIQKFESEYGAGDVQIMSAPGRSEILGNHTDHQQGEILAASINLDAVAVVRPLPNGEIRLISEDGAEIVTNSEDDQILEAQFGTTLSLIKGVCAGVRKHGFKTGGFCACVTSDVLVGAGLSSSAAFEILIGTILSYLYNEGKIPADLNAIIGQFAENVYFGKPCGLMDQMACSQGDLVHVNFADPKNPVIEKVAFDLKEFGYCLCITDTKGSHVDLTADYACIPKEMKDVAKVLGYEVLRDVTMEELIGAQDVIREKCSDRALLRAIHFVQENKRVQRGVEALKRKDIQSFLHEVEKSGDSSSKYLQNVYSSKDPLHQKVVVALAFSDCFLGDEYGVCRIHGGGFAGTIQAFVKIEKASEYQKEMDQIFGKGACSVLQIRKYGGMRIIE